MNRSGSQKLFFILLMSSIFLLIWFPVSAQDDNLLNNPGFEDPFNTLEGEPPIQIAQGWTPWYVPASPGSPTFANRQPEFEPTAPDEERILEGENAQLISSFFATHDGGVYQRVTGVTAGAELRFAVHAYVWSTTFDEVDLSEEDGDVLVQVGIDPTGGTDGESDDIVWSEAGVELYDAYNEYTVDAEAESTAVTVFVRTTVGIPVKNNYIYLDEASLTVVGEEEPEATNTPVTPTETNTPVTPTSTETPEEEETETPVPPTETSEPDTDTPVPPTETPEPTDEPEEATVTPTIEDEEPTIDPVILTATAIVSQATQTASVALTETASVPTTDPQVLTATAILEDATSTASASQTAAAITPSATPTPSVTMTPSVTSTPSTTPTPTQTQLPLEVRFPNTITHVVQRGESVFIIAQLYGTTIEAIAEANGLSGNYLIHVGQNLIVPVPVPAPATSTYTPEPVVVVTATPAVPVPPLGAGGTYTVRPGDNLSRIARLFNTNVETLAQLNGIVNVNRIQVGQVIQLPSAPETQPTPTPAPERPPQTYQIRPGDTLYRISIQFGVTIAQIAQANNIINPNRIFYGQVITIP